MLRHIIVSAALALIAITGAACAQGVAPTGPLRAVLLANPVQGKIDPRTGAVTGPAADLMQGLARSLNVSFSLKGLANAKAVTDEIRNGVGRARSASPSSPNDGGRGVGAEVRGSPTGGQLVT